jgi:hypothetical protein
MLDTIDVERRLTYSSALGRLVAASAETSKRRRLLIGADALALQRLRGGAQQ